MFDFYLFSNNLLVWIPFSYYNYLSTPPKLQIFEIALPLCFVTILIAIKNATDDSDQTSSVVPVDFPTNEDVVTSLSFHDYVTAIQAKRECELQDLSFFGIPYKDLGITGMPRQALNWMVPVVKCDHRRCQEPGEDAEKYCEYQTLAVTGSDEDGLQRAEDFKNWIYETYPALTSERVRNKFDYDFVQLMPSVGYLESYIKDSRYGEEGVPKVAMAVVFEGNEMNRFVYTLRQNSTNYNNPEEEARPGARTTPPTNQQFDSYAKTDNECPEDENGGVPEQGFYQSSCTGAYLYNGVLTFQRLVGDYILSKTGADQRYPVSRNGARFVPFPTPEYEEEGFFADIAAFAPLLVTLGLLYPVAAMIRYVTREKELRQKELMKMMSVTESDIGWSWFLTFLLLHFFTATFTSMVSGVLFDKSDSAYLWWFWLLTFISFINFCLVVSTITSKANRAVLVGLLMFFAGMILGLVFDYQEASSSAISLVSLHPVTAFTYGLQEIFYLEDRGVGLRASTVDTSDYPSGYTFANAVNALIGDMILWGILSWYLNRIIKPDYGQAMPWNFPFTLSYWCPGAARAGKEEVDEAAEEAVGHDIPFEPVPETLRRQAEEGKSIEIRNLKRCFGDKIAVDGLNLSMYNGSITALLGKSNYVSCHAKLQ